MCVGCLIRAGFIIVVAIANESRYPRKAHINNIMTAIIIIATNTTTILYREFSRKLPRIEMGFSIISQERLRLSLSCHDAGFVVILYSARAALGTRKLNTRPLRVPVCGAFVHTCKRGLTHFYAVHRGLSKNHFSGSPSLPRRAVHKLFNLIHIFGELGESLHKLRSSFIQGKLLLYYTWSVHVYTGAFLRT